MNQEFKPSGYNSLSPYFVVKGAEKLIDLLIQIFGAKELRRFAMPDGTIMHAELQIDDTVVMMGEASEKFPSNQLLIHVYVRNVDEVFETAINSGCLPVESPKQRNGEPNRRGSFKDFSGNIWAIATKVE